MYKPDYKDISIIDSLPTWNHEKIILNIGCGPGDLDCYLSYLGYRVYATDMYKQKEWESHKNFWSDEDNSDYKNVNEFVAMANPYATAISKNVTKDLDWKTNQKSYLIIVNKRYKKI